MPKSDRPSVRCEFSQLSFGCDVRFFWLSLRYNGDQATEIQFQKLQMSQRKLNKYKIFMKFTSTISFILNFTQRYTLHVCITESVIYGETKVHLCINRHQMFRSTSWLITMTIEHRSTHWLLTIQYQKKSSWRDRLIARWPTFNHAITANQSDDELVWWQPNNSSERELWILNWLIDTEMHYSEAL